MLWFHCDIDTGAIVAGGIAPSAEVAAMQATPEGCALLTVPDGSISNVFSQTPDFRVLREMLTASVDAQAGAARARFITDVPGQAQTYEKKEAEARRWVEGDNAADYPFMAAEAEATGQSMAAVQASIMAKVNLLTPVAAGIEGARIAAKMAISAASTLPAIVAASQVDWDAVIAASQINGEG